jgi:hypothetical protein
LEEGIMTKYRILLGDNWKGSKKRERRIYTDLRFKFKKKLGFNLYLCSENLYTVTFELDVHHFVIDYMEELKNIIPNVGQDTTIIAIVSDSNNQACYGCISGPRSFGTILEKYSKNE